MAERPIDLDSSWLARLRDRALQPPCRPRLPLLWGKQVMGSVEPGVLQALCRQGPTVHALAMAQGCLQDMGTHWLVTGDATESLNLIARALHHVDAARVRAQWRDEQLAVHDGAGQEIARVERGAVRALGIATRAVHLVGHAPHQHMWIQQRAWSKATEPGLWDTLMGGMVSAQDTLESALERETWEEAGLRLEQVQGLRRGGEILVQRPNGADDGVGYMVEQTYWYEALVPQGVVPCNQDGEVAQFACVSRDELLHMLHGNVFTTEAALVLVRCLQG